MSLVLSAEPPPLVVDSLGVVRVAGTRVTLDTIVAAFHDGATSEEIAEQYPSVQLSDIYAVIGFYLRRRAEVDEYLAARVQLGCEVQRENEAMFNPSGVRARLLARRMTDARG
jgi:uncharacterized protein (DUF433 family)